MLKRISAILFVGACAAPDLSTDEQEVATVVGSFVDPAGVHPDAQITMPGGTMPAAGWPLVMAFHRSSGTHTEALSRMGFGNQSTWPASPIADRAIIIWPDGELNGSFRVWDATSACCQPSLTVDDIGYAEAAYTYALSIYTIDVSHVAAMGLSNGGFMSEALGCSHPEHWNHVVDVSGDPPKPCGASDGMHTVSIFKDHGDDDTTVFWNSTTPTSNSMTISGMHDTYPAADDASQYGCTSFVDSGVTKDYESVTGAETHVLNAVGCPTGTTVTLYRAYGGTHSPGWVTSHWQPDVLAYLGI